MKFEDVKLSALLFVNAYMNVGVEETVERFSVSLDLEH